MKVEKVLFAIPSITKDRKRQIFNSVEGLKVEMLTIPGTADIVSGKVGVTQLRSVQIEELLGRDEVKSSEALLGRCITEKVVLVSGAGGSIGSELCRKIIMQRPRQLILLERSEYSLYEIEKELTNLDLGVEIYPILGSVRDKNLIDKLFSAYSVQTVYHAAAYKHVPLVEYNVKAGIENNVWGTRIIAQAARDYKADHFVLVSTDKAVRPTNVMGTSKRIAELIVQDLASTSAQTIFSIVRFGNVLGSSGSVIPLFRKQIEKGGPITVTHPEITRYFMTIPEAASLVIQAGAMARGGEVFVLDMGKPVKIAELAKKMVRLMGLTIKSIENPGGDIDIAYTGLRPGEKLYEELLIGGDVTNTEHSRIMRANEISMGSTDLEKLLDEIQVALKVNDLDKVINTLIASPAGFSPSTPLCDIIWKTERSSPAKENNNQKIERNVYALHENE